MLQSYLLTFNRMVGGADEMGSFLIGLKEHLERENLAAEQREQELSLKDHDLKVMREALEEAIKDKNLGDVRRSELEATLARVPDLFKRNYEHELQTQLQATQELIRRHVNQSAKFTSLPWFDPREIQQFNQQMNAQIDRTLLAARALEAEKRRKGRESQKNKDLNSAEDKNEE